MLKRVLAKLEAVPRWLFAAWIVAGPFLAFLLRELFKDRLFDSVNNWLDEKLGPVLSAIASSALWLVWMAAFGGILLLVWWLAKRTIEVPSTTAGTANSSSQLSASGAYEGAHYDLLQFVLHHLLPTLDSQSVLQSKIIEERIENKDLAELAKAGIEKPLEFDQGPLNPLLFSPVGYVSFDEMIAAVAALEDRVYGDFFERGERLLNSDGYVPSQAVRATRADWLDRHNAMVEAYEKIKTDPRFPKPIYRGALRSRWGGQIDIGEIITSPIQPSDNAISPDRQRMEVAALSIRGELGAVAFRDGSNIGDLEVSLGETTYRIAVSLDGPEPGRSIRVWNHGEAIHSVSVVRGISQGQYIDVDAVHPARDHITMTIGDRAIALTKDARMIQLVLVSVRDRSAGDAVDAVRFRYNVHERGAHLLAAM